MSQVLDFLQKAGVFYLATTEGDKPHVRPMGFVMDFDGKISFMTDNRKNMYKQMVANPNIEISSFDGQGNTLRICGKAVFATTSDAQKKALEVMPALSGAYAVDDGVFEIFYMDDAKAVCQTMSGETQEYSM